MWGNKVGKIPPLLSGFRYLSGLRADVTAESMEEKRRAAAADKID